MTLKFGNPLLVAALLPLVSLPAKAQDTTLLSRFVSAESGSDPAHLRSCSAQFFKPRIVFARELNGNQRIYSIASDGTDLRQLTNGSADRNPSCNATGSKIVFQSFRDNPDEEIYSMNADGSNQTRLTNNTVSDREPSISKDGAKIVFVRGSLQGSSQIYIMNINGTGVTCLTNNHSNDVYFTKPSFSNDGSKIIFNVNYTDVSPYSTKIFVMNSDGTGVVSLSNDAMQTRDLYPMLSPNGKYVVFVRGNSGIWVMDSDGGNQRNITNASGWLDQYPNFSADGKKIVFLSSRNSPDNYDRDLYIMNADGSDQARVVHGYLPGVRGYAPYWAQPRLLGF